MSRNLLHKSKLEAFKAWLVEQDVPFRTGKGEWQELQVRLPNSTVYAALYSRADMPEHLTVDRRLDSLVARFCREGPSNRSTTGNNPRTNPRGCPEVSALVEALESLIKGYVKLLQAGRDRITSLGGDCDPIHVMEQNDPWLRDARNALATCRNQGEDLDNH